MPELRLDGCRSRPLIGYLKSLGVLRTVARQRDPDACGRWRAGTFELRSELSREELLCFLAAGYEPSPILSPWNSGSGFYPKGNTAAVKALEGVEATTHERLGPYRDLIAATRGILRDLEITVKPDGAVKDKLLMALRRRWPDAGIEWLDAAVVLAGGEPRYPPLLGSGGNDGRFDFSSNYLEAVGRLDDPAPKVAGPLLESALSGKSETLERLSAAYLQRDFSPTNSPRGDDEGLGNPWDLMLSLEGSLVLVGGAARRHADGPARITAPFAVRATGAGYGSAAPGEEGHEEIWLPLWSGWATQREVDHLVREGRAQVRSSHSVRWARSGLDLARAAGELGVARGVGGFERYAILNRAGQSRLAVPAGRIAVRPVPAAEALRTLDRTLDRFLRLAAAKNCPRGVERAVRLLERTTFDLASRGRRSDALATLHALGQAEQAIARSGSARASGVCPVAGVAAKPWLDLCDDGSSEFAVAASLGSLRDGRTQRRSPAMRDYLHGTAGHGTEYDDDRRHQISAPSAMALLAAIHARRHLDVQRSGGGGLAFDSGTWTELGAARAFSVGLLEEGRILGLVRSICLLDHDGSTWRPRPRAAQEIAQNPSFDLLALAWAARSGEEARGARPGWAARLAAGRPAPVLGSALLELRRGRRVPLLKAADLVAGGPDALRLGAALLLPIGPRDIERLSRRLIQTDVSTDNPKEETA